MLRIGIHDIERALDAVGVEQQLTAVARVRLAAAVTLARGEVVRRFAVPAGAPVEALAVVGMGKLGADELNYHSDLDLVFVYEAGAPAAWGDHDAHAVFTRVAQRTISALNTPTVEGVAYQIDTRLRPSGNQGSLVTSLAGFEEEACLELLAQAQAGFFDLESHVALTGAGTLRALKTPGELFARFTPQPAETDSPVVQRAFALVKALQSERRLREPSVVATFALYCLDGLSVSRIARRFGCSRGTVLNRLDLIRRRTRNDPNRFRQLSPHLARTEEALSDPRARSIYRKGALYGDGQTEE